MTSVSDVAGDVEPPDVDTAVASDKIMQMEVVADAKEILSAPDGGYGWVIVLASFLSDGIADGIAFSFGIFLEEFLDYFKESNNKTAWIGSLFHGIPLLAGPLSGALINRYGCRRVSIAGGIISSLGFIFSYFAVNIEFLCFSFGIVSGIGLSLVYTPSVVIVSIYFNKKRSFATGLAASGSGVGSVVFAPLIEYMIREYGWKSTLWLTGGIMLNFVACGALYRPLVPRRKPSSVGCQETASNTSSSSVINEPKVTSKAPPPPLDGGIRQLATCKPPTVCVSEVNGGLSQPLLDGASVAVEDSNSMFKCAIINNQKQTNENHDSRQCVEGAAYDSINQKPLLLDPCDRLFSSTISIDSQYRRHFAHNRAFKLVLPDSQLGIAGSCPNVFYSQPIPEESDDATAPSCGMCAKRCDTSFVKGVLREMMDFSLLKNPKFSMFFASNFLLYMWFDVAYFYLPEYATQVAGMTVQESSFAVSIIGVSNTVGQIFFGYLGDRSSLNTVYVYATAICICGVSTAFAPLCTTNVTVYVYSALFGVFIGADYALCSVIVIQFLSIDKLTNAYGLMMCGQGLANLIGPPLAGLLFDITGTYQATFITGGVLIAVAGVMMFFIDLVKHCDGSNPSKKVVASR